MKYSANIYIKGIALKMFLGVQSWTWQTEFLIFAVSAGTKIGQKWMNQSYYATTKPVKF